jgi:hypothetical protein
VRRPTVCDAVKLKCKYHNDQKWWFHTVVTHYAYNCKLRIVQHILE